MFQKQNKAGDSCLTGGRRREVLEATLFWVLTDDSV